MRTTRRNGPRQLIALRPVPVPPVVQEYGTNTTTDMAKWVVVGLTGTGAGAGSTSRT